jgi:S-adenosylmethionine synthetase
MLKTAEAVTPQHPDKLCDQISDAILDACLKQDNSSRVAIETMGGHNIITITGELTTRAHINVSEIVRGLVGDNYGIQTNIVSQSPEIARGVDTGGAGDQGIMVGYACNENEALIPQEIYLAKSLCRFIYDLHPNDGKVQVTINDNLINTIVVSFCNVNQKELKELVSGWLIKTKLNQPKNIYLNPAGDWYFGGFISDTGVTGRKLACDNYGPQIPIGGGAFSGKDATKVDRSGAYMARKIAVDLLKKYQAKEVLVKIAYSIGIAEPVMATARITKINYKIINIKIKNYDLRPQAIINFLDLNKPQYQQVAAWGSFGDNSFRWNN